MFRRHQKFRKRPHFQPSNLPNPSSTGPLLLPSPPALRPDPPALLPDPAALLPDPAALLPDPAALLPDPSALPELIFYPWRRG